jgi:hypothetical protein
MSSPFVTTTISYCGTEGAPERMRFDLTAIITGVSAPRDAHELPVYDARQIEEKPTLDRNGFTLASFPTEVTDFLDEDQVEKVYYPEVEEFLKRQLGAEEVFMFGHIMRTDDPDAAQERSDRIASGVPLERSKSGPAGGAHVDFDEQSVRAYIPELVGEDRAEELAQKHFVNVNVWRGISKVERMPLALCDASTCDLDQMRPVDMYNAVGPNSTMKVGLSVQYDPGHRWYYYPDMTPDEVLVFKQFDSDPAAVRRTPHSAIVDPNSAADAAPRYSMEIRALCFLPD